MAESQTSEAGTTVTLTAPKGVVACTAPDAAGRHVEHRVSKAGTVSVHPAAVERLEALGFARADATA